MGVAAVDDDALLGALAAFRSLDSETRKETAQAVRSTLRPLWQNIVATRRRVAQGVISPRQDAIIGKGSVAFTSAGSGSLKAYNNKVVLSGGLSSDNWQWIEFGTLKPGYSQTRLPRFTKGGRMGYKGVKSWAPAAARVYLGVLYDVLRTIPGTEDE